MASYTKGEWKVRHPVNNDYTIYIGEYGKGIEQIAILFENKPNVEANANLIAAAPAIYEALKLFQERLLFEREHEWNYPIGLELPSVWAEKALAKAEGKQ